MSEVVEVRKCPKCGTRVNWKWMETKMNDWGRRCSDPVCQDFGAWVHDGWEDQRGNKVEAPLPADPE